MNKKEKHLHKKDQAKLQASSDNGLVGFHKKFLSKNEKSH